MRREGGEAEEAARAVGPDGEKGGNTENQVDKEEEEGEEEGSFCCSCGDAGKICFLCLGGWGIQSGGTKKEQERANGVEDDDRSMRAGRGMRFCSLPFGSSPASSSAPLSTTIDTRRSERCNTPRTFSNTLASSAASGSCAERINSVFAPKLMGSISPAL